jgi:phage terminase large subunit
LEPLLAPARYKGAYGGRAGTKSWFFAQHLIERCILQPTRAVCVREVQRSLEQSVKRLLEDVIRRLGIGHLFDVKQSQIVAPHNGLIIFQGMQTYTAESIKSLEGFDVAWIEEAQNLSQHSLNLLRPTMFRTKGSEIWASWNPRDPSDPVDDFFRGNKVRKAGESPWKPPPDTVLVRTSYRDNPWLLPELRKEIEWDKARDPEKYAHIWLGEYERRSESRVFKNWTVDEFETPDDTMFYLGADWGFSIDPSVLIRCFVQGRKLFIDYEAYRIGCEIDHLPALFDTVPGARAWPVIADSARPETISYLTRHGFPRLEAAHKGKDSVKEGIIFLQGYDVVIHPRCVHAIDEFTLYSYKRDPLTDEVSPILEDKKNHVIDAVRYAVERLRHGFDYKSAGMTSEATW